MVRFWLHPFYIEAVEKMSIEKLENSIAKISRERIIYIDKYGKQFSQIPRFDEIWNAIPFYHKKTAQCLR